MYQNAKKQSFGHLVRQMDLFEVYAMLERNRALLQMHSDRPIAQVLVAADAFHSELLIEE
jgi:hypothetical protein